MKFDFFFNLCSAKGTPAATTEEGSYFLDTRTNHLEWQIPNISADNANGSLGTFSFLDPSF